MPGQPVILEEFGGVVATARPEDIPEGAAARATDVDFIVGRFIQRGGAQNQYSYSGAAFGPNGGSTALDVALGGAAWTNPTGILLNDGSFATVSLPATSTQSANILVINYNHLTLILEVSFTTTLPTGLFPYTFSGLTHLTALNGQTITPYSVSGSNAFFSFNTGGGDLHDSTDTGSASIAITQTESDYLQVTGFGFAVPSAASILGFTVNVKGFSPQAAPVFVQLMKNGVPVGNIHTVTLPTSNAFVASGSSTDPWGSLWQFSDVNASGFGVALWASNSGAVSISLDYVDIVVSASTTSANFNGIANGNLLGNVQTTVALDANGTSWQENVSATPNVLSTASLVPSVPAGTYMKGVDAGNGAVYMAYSDLTQGVAPPMQYNGQWCDRITQVGPGAPPTFAASQQAGTQATVTAYAFSAGILTLTSTNTFTAGELVTFSGFSAGAAALNGLTFSVLGTGLSGSQFEIATSLVAGSGSDSGTATPQYSYPIAPSATGIVQPPANSDITDPAHLSVLLWSSGPGSTTAGNTVTVYYSPSYFNGAPQPTAQDTQLVNAFNAGFPVYVYISGAPFANGTWQVTSVGNDLPPGVSHFRYYFTIQMPTSGYQNVVEPAGQYQVTQATITLLTAVPGLAPGSQVSLSGVSNSAWDQTFSIVEALNSGSFSITQTALASGTATYSWTLVSGSAPAAGQLVTVTGTLNGNGIMNVANAVIATASGTVSGTFTVNGFATTSTFSTTVEAGQATTAGTQFIIDPGAALVGNVAQNPILGNSGGGLLTIVGQAIGGTFPIGAGTRQGVCFFITRNGAVTRPSPPFTFTVAVGANYITASQIPIGPPNVIARGIAFTEAGQNGVAGANFYTYSTPVTFVVGGVIFTASALIVPDNVTTTAKFTFSDSVLLSSNEIDTPGNNYFALQEIGDPAWIFQYANRMMYGLCRTKIQNLLNMSFDGGYLPTSGNAPLLPLGWNVDPAYNPAFGPSLPITAFSITSNVVTFTCGNAFVAGQSVAVGGLSTGTYLNDLTLVVTSSSGSAWSANFVHANVGVTSDSGHAAAVNVGVQLLTSPIFGNALYVANKTGVSQAKLGMITQSAYLDAYNVPIIEPNIAYSVRVVARTPASSGPPVTIDLVNSNNSVYGQSLGSFTFTSTSSNFATFTGTLIAATAPIPSGLLIRCYASNVTYGQDWEIDRIEIFPTNKPVDTTTIWTSYVGAFESVDEDTGSLGCGVDNPQAAQGAYQILESLYVEKTGSKCITQDSPNYEPSQWTVKTIAAAGSTGPNALYEGEEFSITASRNGVYLFDGGKPMPISRELQSTGTRGSIWETINWNAGKTIWVRFDLVRRRLFIGIPMITPNFWLPNAAVLMPTSPNVMLMCNFTGCATAEELAASPPVHTTMFGDLKALDMRRKWSIWQVPSPVTEFVPRQDGFSAPLFVCNGIASSKIYQFVAGAPSGGQNTDDGAAINWNYTTYGLTKAKQGQQQPGLGALRKVAYYLTATMEGIGQIAGKLYANSLGALAQNTYTIPLPFTLSYPQQNDQERPLELGGERIFLEFTPIGTGGYAEVGQVIVDMEADRWSSHRGISS